jgi:hypothetical protein
LNPPVAYLTTVSLFSDRRMIPIGSFSHGSARCPRAEFRYGFVRPASAWVTLNRGSQSG